MAAIDLPALPANIEVDIIFPRNETYAPANNFPIILALQNAALAWDFGWHVTWDLTNLSVVSSTSQDFVEGESILVPNFEKLPAPSNTFFIANSTEKLGGSYYRASGLGTYRLSWTFNLMQNCTEDGDFIDHSFGARLGDGELVFTIADGGKGVDFLDGGACPPSGGAIGIQSNITACAHVDSLGVEAQPCNIVIDEALASSLSAQLPAIALPTSTTSTPSTASSPSKTTTGPSGLNTGATSGTTSPLATSTTSNHAPHRGALQTAAAVLAGAAGLCAVLV